MGRSRTGFGPIALAAAFAAGALAGGAWVASSRRPEAPAREPPAQGTARNAEPALAEAPAVPVEPAAAPDEPPGHVLVLDGPALPPRAAVHVRRLRDDPELRGHRFVVRWADPYVVAVQYPPFTDPDEAHKNRDRIANASRLADVHAALLVELHRRFREMFGERCGLPDLRGAAPALLAVVAWSEDDHRDLYSRVVGRPLPEWAGVLYAPSARTLFLWIGFEALTFQDELPAAADRSQKRLYASAFHEGTIQLLDEFARRRRASDAAPGDAPAPRRAMWFEEGLAELMAGVEVEGAARDLSDAEFLHARLHLERIRDVRDDSRESAAEWRLADLLAVGDEDDLLERARRLRPWSRETQALLFVARAWGLVHFLWHYDGGVHRARLLDVCDAVLDGRTEPDALARLLGITDGAERSRLEEEFEWYWERCLARAVGPTPSGNGWYRPETDPPAGRAPR